MSKFELYFLQTASTSVTIDADDLESAIEQAYNKLPGSLCHHCARDFDMSGDWELDQRAADEDYPEATP